MSWIDALLFGVASVQAAGVSLPQERVLNFYGATLADDPLNGRTDITMTGSSGAALSTYTSGNLPSARVQIVGFNLQGVSQTGSFNSASQLGDKITLTETASPQQTSPQVTLTLTDPNNYQIQDPNGQGVILGSNVVITGPGPWHWTLMKDYVSGVTAWRCA